MLAFPNHVVVRNIRLDDSSPGRLRNTVDHPKLFILVKISDLGYAKLFSTLRASAESYL